MSYPVELVIEKSKCVSCATPLTAKATKIRIANNFFMVFSGFKI